MKTILLELNDEFFSSFYLVKTNKSEQEIQKEVDNIIENYEENNYEDWTYDDVVYELENKNLIENIGFDDTYSIIA